MILEVYSIPVYDNPTDSILTFDPISGKVKLRMDANNIAIPHFSSLAEPKVNGDYGSDLEDLSPDTPMNDEQRGL